MESGRDRKVTGEAGKMVVKAEGGLHTPKGRTKERKDNIDRVCGCRGRKWAEWWW